jgi:uroporphyrinogen III methyltransferase/synthase
MAAILEKAGLSVIFCPTIEIIPPDSWSGLDEAITRINTYDWIIFTSANAVKFFNQRLGDLGLDISIINSLVSCCIGRATGSALESTGARLDVTAADSVAEGALGAIVARAGNTDAIRGLRFLIPRAQVAREFLPEELRKLGAGVDTVDAYKTVKPDLDRQAITGLLQERRIDAITFTSPSTVDHFFDLVANRNLATLLKGVLIACIGPVTAAAARRRGLDRIIQPASHHGEALARVIIDALAP